MTKEEFKKFRQQFKLNGEGMARRIGKTITETHEYESGKRSIPEEVEKYLRAFKKDES